jgi:hypothetical protein
MRLQQERRGRSAKPSEVASKESVRNGQWLDQNSITEGLLQMAMRLRESSVIFSDAAREGLDCNTSGMQTAGEIYT